MTFAAFIDGLLFILQIDWATHQVWSYILLADSISKATLSSELKSATLALLFLPFFPKQKSSSRILKHHGQLHEKDGSIYRNLHKHAF